MFDENEILKKYQDDFFVTASVLIIKIILFFGGITYFQYVIYYCKFWFGNSLSDWFYIRRQQWVNPFSCYIVAVEDEGLTQTVSQIQKWCVSNCSGRFRILPRKNGYKFIYNTIGSVAFSDKRDAAMFTLNGLTHE